jgi:hypothetical protein
VYFLDPLAVDRILAYDPDMKVILGVRDPVGYAISQYNQIEAFGFEVPPVEEMVKGYTWQLAPKVSLRLDLRGQFLSRRIEELREKFGDNLLLYDFRRFQKSPLALMQVIERFVGIPRYFDENNVVNVAINASARRNIKFLNALLRRQEVLDVIYAILPRAVTRTARTMFDRLSANERSTEPASRPSDDQIAALNAFFAEDSRFVNDLFAGAPMQLGSGRRIDEPADI